MSPGRLCAPWSGLPWKAAIADAVHDKAWAQVHLAIHLLVCRVCLPVQPFVEAYRPTVVDCTDDKRTIVV